MQISNMTRKPGSYLLTVHYHSFSSEYWTREKTRFHAFLQQLHQTMPQFRAPVLILYWPIQQNLDKDLRKLIPQLINVYNSSVVSDYRVVIMTPRNACEELPGSIEWLGKNGRKPAPLVKTPKVEGMSSCR